MIRLPRSHRLAVVGAGVALLAGAIAEPAHAQDSSKLTLDQIIAKAKTNPLVKAARYRAQADAARADEASGLRLARIGVTGFVAPSPNIDCDDPACTTTSPTDVRVNIDGVYGGVDVSLTQPLFTFGKLSAARQAAQRGAAASAHLADDTLGQIAVGAARAYYGIKLSRELTWMLEDGKKEIESGKLQLEKLLADGSDEVTVQDRLRLEVLLAEVEARMTESRQAEQTALAAIRALTGDRSADVDDELLEVAPAGAQSADAIAAQSRQSDPRVRAARGAQAAMGALEDLERARYLPDLALVGGFRFARAQGVDDPPSAFASDPFNRTTAHVALVMRWQIDPLAQPARVARARAESRRAEAVADAAGQLAELEARTAYTKVTQAAERLAAAKRGERSARGWMASVLQAEAVGVAAAKDIVDAYTAYFTLRARVLQTTYDHNLAVFALRRATGEFRAAR